MGRVMRIKGRILEGNNEAYLIFFGSAGEVFTLEFGLEDEVVIPVKGAVSRYASRLAPAVT